jgi:hypothetical protein
VRLISTFHTGETYMTKPNDYTAAIEHAKNAPRIDPSAPRPGTAIPGHPTPREVLGGFTDRPVAPAKAPMPASDPAKG